MLCLLALRGCKLEAEDVAIQMFEPFGDGLEAEFGSAVELRVTLSGFDRDDGPKPLE